LLDQDDFSCELIEVSAVPHQTERQSQQSDSPDKVLTSRIIWGGTILVIGFMSPLLIPVVAYMPISEKWAVAISGLLLVGIPEVFMLIAVAVMGNSGYEYLKKYLLRLLRRYGPAENVGVLRHRIGLCMFIVPLLIGLLSPYVGDALPLYLEYQLQIAIASDILFISSMLVLGGEFWDKLRGLFIHDARITLPEQSA
jgi:hypothetical protein